MTIAGSIQTIQRRSAVIPATSASCRARAISIELFGRRQPVLAKGDSSEAIQILIRRKVWIASLALAMTEQHVDYRRGAPLLPGRQRANIAVLHRKSHAPKSLFRMWVQRDHPCPDGSRKYWAWLVGQISRIFLRIPPHRRGALRAIVTTREAGMRWPSRIAA